MSTPNPVIIWRGKLGSPSARIRYDVPRASSAAAWNGKGLFPQTLLTRMTRSSTRPNKERVGGGLLIAVFSACEGLAMTMMRYSSTTAVSLLSDRRVVTGKFIRDDGDLAYRIYLHAQTTCRRRETGQNCRYRLLETLFV